MEKLKLLLVIMFGALLGSLFSGCATGSSDVALRKVETAHDIAQEICLLAHAFNSRLHVDPQMTINQGKIDSICDPTLQVLATASGDEAKQALATLRAQIAELLR